MHSSAIAAPSVHQASSWEELDAVQSSAIRAHAARLGRPIEILEAGCGRRWTLDLGGIDYTLTGVDLDRAALEARQHVERDLHVAIYGDLCQVLLPVERYDVVYSSFVLEHVERADLALRNLVTWLRPGGLLILRLPERATARGFLARVLPHWAHVLYYRHVLGFEHAGEPGFAPYRTFYHPVLARDELVRFLAQNELECTGVFGDGFRDEGRGLLRHAVRAMLAATAMLSLGRLTADYVDLLYLARKADESGPGPLTPPARGASGPRATATKTV